MTNVIEIGDFSIERQRRWPSRMSDECCKHRQITLEEEGEIVRCRDCKAQVAAFWVLSEMLPSFTDRQERTRKNIQLERDLMIEEARKIDAPVNRRALELAKIWRGKMLPCCPHCGVGIMPEDKFGATCVGKEYEMAHRAKKQAHTKEDR